MQKILKDFWNCRHDFKKRMEKKENPDKYCQIAVKQLLYLCSKKLHFTFTSNIYIQYNEVATLQTHHVYSTLKGRGNDRFHVVLTRNTRGVFAGNALFDRTDTHKHLNDTTKYNGNTRIMSLQSIRYVDGTHAYTELTKIDFIPY